MASKTLEQKTIRPGSLGNYSYYYSKRSNPEPAKPSSFSLKKLLLVFLLFGAVFFGFQHSRSQTDSVVQAPQQQSAVSKASSDKKTPSTAQATATKVNQCESNTEPKFIIVSISQRKLWACEGSKQVYDSKVITGMEKHPSTETPEGTYTVYAKHKDTVLTGSDETGSWRDPVSYWMPFLDNQYGTYGFHDATWREDKEFGSIDPLTSDDASHGCVEMPLAAQKWLFEWAEVGTNLTIKS